MRTQKELQGWLDNHLVDKDEFISINKWLQSCEEYDSVLLIYCKENGATLQDVIDFVNSEPPQIDHSQIVAQYEKVRKEMNKLEKLINRMR